MRKKDLAKKMEKLTEMARKARNCENDNEAAYIWYEVAIGHLELGQIEKAASAACTIPQRCGMWIVRAFFKIAEACHKSDIEEEKEETKVFLEMAAGQIERVEEEYQRKLFLELSEKAIKLNCNPTKYIDMIFLKLENEIKEIKEILLKS